MYRDMQLVKKEENEINRYRAMSIYIYIYIYVCVCVCVRVCVCVLDADFEKYGINPFVHRS